MLSLVNESDEEAIVLHDGDRKREILIGLQTNDIKKNLELDGRYQALSWKTVNEDSLRHIRALFWQQRNDYSFNKNDFLTQRLFLLDMWNTQHLQAFIQTTFIG